MRKKNDVATAKRSATQKPDKFLKDLGLGDRKELLKLLKYSSSMEYGEEVNFDNCREMFGSVMPKGKALALTKVKSRKSFVKLDQGEMSVGRVKPTPKKRAAPKSLKRTVHDDSSKSDDDEEESQKVKPTRKQQKRTTKTPAKRRDLTVDSSDVDEADESQTAKPTRKQQRRGTKTPAKPADEEADSSHQFIAVVESSKSSKVRSTRITRNTTHKVDTTDDEVDTEITFKVNSRAKSRVKAESTRVKAESTRVKLELETSEAPEQTLFSDSSLSDDESINPPEKENHPPRKEVAEKKVAVKNKPMAPTRKKKMMQPGQLINPAENSMQTVRSNGKPKSWLREHPNELKKLRMWIRGEADSYK